MISLEDCISMCGLSEKEVAAIAEHEHIPEIAAATLGRYLLGQSKGSDAVSRMILDDIRVAFAQGNVAHAAELVSALRHLHAEYPCVAGKA